jgi:hypothetical protein
MIIEADDWHYFFNLNECTGELLWSVQLSTRGLLGTPAGYIDAHGYRIVMISGQKYKAHRIVWEMLNGKIPEGMVIDHINGIKSDNAPDNLRLATYSQNNANASVKRFGKEFKGASFDKRKGKWKGQLRKNGIDYFLGYYETAEEAARAYDAAALTHHGEFATLNFKPELHQ